MILHIPHDVRLRLIRRFLLATAILATLLGSRGFAFPVLNNVFHVPIVLRYAQTPEGPHDAYTESLSKFVTWCWPALSTLTTEHNLEAVFLAAFVATLLALIMAFLWLVELPGWGTRATPTGLAYAAAILLFPTLRGSTVLGDTELVVTQMTQTFVVVPVALLAIGLVLGGRPLAAAAVAGAAFNINAIVGAWAAAILGLAAVWSPPEATWRLRTAIGTRMAGVFLAVASPTIVWIARCQLETPPFQPFDFVAYLREYYPFHTLVDVQPSAALFTLALMAMSWRMATLASTAMAPATRRAWYGLHLGVFAVLLAGSVLPYLTQSQLINNLYPLRMDTWLYWLSAIGIAAWMSNHRGEPVTPDAQAVRWPAWIAFINGNPLVLLAGTSQGPTQPGRRRLDRDWLWFASVLVCLLVAACWGRAWSIRLPRGGWGYASVPILQSLLLGLTTPRTATTAPLAALSPSDLRRFALACLAWSVLVVPPPDGSRPEWIAALSLLLASAAATVWQKALPTLLLAIAGTALLALQPTATQWVRLALLGVPAFFLGLAISRIWHRTSPPTPATSQRPPRGWLQPAMAPAAVGAILLTLAGLRLVREGGIVRLPPRDRALLDAQRWARSNSPPGSLFLPLGIDGFSTLSRRPVWVDWKVGAVVMWAPNLHATWSSRHAELKRVRSIPDGLDLARREGCAYLVCDASFNGAPTPMDTLVYSNAACRIYRVAEAKTP